MSGTEPTVADPDAYRAVMARLISGVSVVAIADRHDLAFTATSVVSVSLEPPTLLFCVHQDSRIRETLETSSRWAVSVLSSDGLADAEWLAAPGRPTWAQLDRIPHWRGGASGAAILETASGWAECETEWIAAAGSHDVVVGRVLDAAIVPGRTGAVVHQLSRMTAYR